MRILLSNMFFFLFGGGSLIPEKDLHPKPKNPTALKPKPPQTQNPKPQTPTVLHFLELSLCLVFATASVKDLVSYTPTCPKTRFRVLGSIAF